jgi:hypothetical protein
MVESSEGRPSNKDNELEEENTVSFQGNIDSDIESNPQKNAEQKELDGMSPERGDANKRSNPIEFNDDDKRHGRNVTGRISSTNVVGEDDENEEKGKDKSPMKYDAERFYRELSMDSD